jgi:hypothetical protein
MRITVGMPVYQGGEYVAGALRSLQEQTFRYFEVTISIEGNDQSTADVCRPFLTDERFRLLFNPSVWTGRVTSVGCYSSHSANSFATRSTTTPRPPSSSRCFLGPPKRGQTRPPSIAIVSGLGDAAISRSDPLSKATFSHGCISSLGSSNPSPYAGSSGARPSSKPGLSD